MASKRTRYEKYRDSRNGMYRRIMGKTRRDKIRNERIREGFKQKSVDEILQKRQVKWFEPVVRMYERRKPRKIMEARTEGRQGRGRPRKAYIDKIEDIARKTGKGIGEMKRMARNTVRNTGGSG